ncbi:MAG: HU family DNA-binding protein [Acidimicrobiaceae bacterium]|nr:HU family DNA-binding protein [Acidimicrobiaceae bacterium]MCY4175656.1 HU family DNA-binding protein [Acidimicrobiaceae bacterium]MCY4279847.1 HU family DNA-binding protein [Acidimicrobiaceae bacterium]MCY4294140.1 HU family DNA-binding protein [Acidimicrobiaceae bacterium]
MSNQMNKGDVVAAVALRAGVSQSDAAKCVDGLLELACDELAAGNSINLTGYMKISTVDRPARTGRNPQTGEPVDIAASTGVKIQPGAKLKAAAKG